MSQDLLLLSLDAAAVVCAVALGIAAVTRGPRKAQNWLVAALCAAAVAHVLLGRQDYAYWIAPPYRLSLGPATVWLNLLRNAGPGLFMIVVFRLCTDRPWPPASLLALFALQLGLEGPLAVARGVGLGHDVVPTLLQAVLVAAAAYWIIADWRGDLVDARRRARALLLLVLGVNVLASSLLLRLIVPSQSRANYETHIILSLMGLLLLAGLLAWGGWVTLQLGTVRAVRPSASVTEDEAAPARLHALMAEARVYRDPGLSLAGLAVRVGLPEYRLRRLIHERLGFRNFNAFLHAHRIAEVVAGLSDPRRMRTPILTLAFEAGYQSVNTFNRGFREVMGMTPSAFRRSTQLDAAEAAAPKSA
jgi:AraC-like DNA-binding protein